MIDKKILYAVIVVLLFVICKPLCMRVLNRKSWISKINISLKQQVQEMGCNYRSNMSKVYQDGTISLDLSNQDIDDISALYVMPLSALSLENTKVSDLSPLSQCKLLKKLNINETLVCDLSPLKNLKVKELFLNQTPVSTLTSLNNMQLITLSICNTPISDISTIDTSALEKLYLDGSNVTNLASLIPENMLCFTFSEKRIYQKKNGTDIIRKMTNCTINCYSQHEQFWKEYAERQSKYTQQDANSE